MQEFRTTDVLRLEVEKDPDGLVNLVQNPSGELGGWGWVTPVPGSALSRLENLGRTALNFTAPGGVPAWFYTENLPITPGEYVAASWVAAQLGTQHKVQFEWLNLAGEVFSWTTQSPYITTNSVETAHYGPFQAPPAAAYVRFRVDFYANTSGGNPPGDWPMSLMDVTVASAPDAADLGSIRTNLVINPSFETNTSSWAATGATLARTTTNPKVGTYAAQVTSSGGSVDLEATTAAGVDAGKAYTISAYVRTASVARDVELWVEFRDAEGRWVDRAQFGGFEEPPPGEWGYISATLETGNQFVDHIWLRLRWNGTAAGEVHYADAVMVEQAARNGTYFDGSSADEDGWDYSWVGAANASASMAVSSNLTYIPPAEYLNVLGPTHDIKVVREALNVSTLTATILDADLDPSQSDTIRPGRRVRLMVKNPNGAAEGYPAWGAFFTGKVSVAKVSYDYKDPAIPAQKRARIELTALDNLTSLANQKRTQGVATIDELPYVLEGCGVPWNVNGSGDQVPTATVVAVNENASAVDQVAVTRDSVLGHAWMDRYGVAQVHDSLEADYVAGGYNLISRATVTDVDIDYDTERCINEVSIDFLRFNPETLETETVSYPAIRRDEDSIRVWGVRSATFTIQGLAEELADLEAFADAVLAANATPTRRVNSVSAAITNPTTHLLWCYWTDLYDKVKVSADFLADEPDIRVTRIEHTITATLDGGRWLMTLGFETDGSVAAPTFVPSPTTGAGGKTIGQLLRPVGERTAFLCAKVDIPAGWLPLDGSTFSAAEYPELAAMLGTTTLPNYTDRFPIGAGTKALLSTGGSPTATINVGSSGTARNLGTRASAVGGGGAVPLGNASAGTVEPLDILNPWVAEWPCVRAV